jgi:hypothetical protein
MANNTFNSGTVHLEWKFISQTPMEWMAAKELLPWTKDHQD